MIKLTLKICGWLFLTVFGVTVGLIQGVLKIK